MTGKYRPGIIPGRWIVCLALLPLLGGFSSYGQSPLPPEEREIVRPLDRLMPSFSPEPKKPVKSFIWILDKDTMSQSRFDPSGNETLTVEYASNRPVSRSLHTYSAGLRTGTRVFAGDLLQGAHVFRYDKNRNPVEWTSTQYSYDKNVLIASQTKRRQWIMEWNEPGRMKKRYSLIDTSKTKTQLSEYVYDASGRLTEINELQWKNLYEYKDGLPVRKTRVFKNDGSVTAAFDYTYDANGLLTGSADNNYVTIYGYDTAGLLKSMTVMKKGDTAKRQDADFYYSDGRLRAVDIRYGDIGMVYVTPAFNMKNLAFYWKGNQANRVHMAFSYDGHGNVTEIKYSVNDLYLYSKRFLYEYY